MRRGLVFNLVVVQLIPVARSSALPLVFHLRLEGDEGCSSAAGRTFAASADLLRKFLSACSLGYSLQCSGRNVGTFCTRGF